MRLRAPNCRPLRSGLTPVLPPDELLEIGFSLAAYPLDLLNASIIPGGDPMTDDKKDEFGANS